MHFNTAYDYKQLIHGHLHHLTDNLGGTSTGSPLDVHSGSAKRKHRVKPPKKRLALLPSDTDTADEDEVMVDAHLSALARKTAYGQDSGHHNIKRPWLTEQPLQAQEPVHQGNVTRTAPPVIDGPYHQVLLDQPLRQNKKAPKQHLYLPPGPRPQLAQALPLQLEPLPAARQPLPMLNNPQMPMHNNFPFSLPPLLHLPEQPERALEVDDLLLAKDATIAQIIRRCTISAKNVAAQFSPMKDPRIMDLLLCQGDRILRFPGILWDFATPYTLSMLIYNVRNNLWDKDKCLGSLTGLFYQKRKTASIEKIRMNVQMSGTLGRDLASLTPVEEMAMHNKLVSLEVSLDVYVDRKFIETSKEFQDIEDVPSYYSALASVGKGVAYYKALKYLGRMPKGPGKLRIDYLDFELREYKNLIYLNRPTCHNRDPEVTVYENNHIKYQFKCRKSRIPQVIPHEYLTPWVAE